MALHKSLKQFGRFVNPHIQNIRRDLFDLMLWKLGYYDDKCNDAATPKDFHYPIHLEPFDRNRPSVVWIGHSTFLIQVGGVTFLTDPMFSSYCSPIPFEILKRKEPPALDISELPPIDVVLISHDHYDHLDEWSVRQLQKRYPNISWVVPKGLKKWLNRHHIQSVYELDWNESCEIKNSRITVVPSQHYSGRKLFDKNRTLWCGFVVESNEKTFYFVGDTGYNAFDFKEIGKKWPSIDLCLIPIGTYVPKEFMQTVHISPYDAVKIHSDVGSRLSLGMHWKTFCLSEEPFDQPPYDLYCAMKERNFPYHTFLPILPGIFLNW